MLSVTSAMGHDGPLFTHRGPDSAKAHPGHAVTKVWNRAKRAFVLPRRGRSNAATAAATAPTLTVVRTVWGYESIGYANGVNYAVYADVGNTARKVLFRSFDEGQSWQQAAAFPSQVFTVTGLASGTLIASTNSLVAGQGQVLWRSADQGLTWQRVSLQSPLSYPGTPTYDTWMAGVPYSYTLLTARSIAADGHGNVYIGTYNLSASLINNTNYVYRSTDDGKTFQIANVTTNHRHIHSINIGPDGYLYLAIGDSGGPDGIWVSKDHGLTLQPVCSGRSDQRCITVMMTFDGFGNILYDTDQPFGSNTIVRVSTATGQPTVLANVPYEGFTGEKLPDGNFLIGNNYEGYGLHNGDSNIHLYAVVGDNVYSVYNYAIANQSIVRTLAVTGVYPNGDVSVYESGVGTLFVRLNDGAPPPLTPPQNTTLPVVSGTPEVGQSLNASIGTWSGNPTPTYTMEWQWCALSGYCVDIPDAYGASYSPVVADVGETLRIKVEAGNSQGSAMAFSAETGQVQAATTTTTTTTTTTPTTTTPTTTTPTTTTPPPVAGNLAPDPDFESNPNASYYTNGNGTFSWASDQARSGSHSLKIASSDSSSMSRWMSLTSLIPVTPGRAYTASVWLKTAGVSDAHLSAVLWSGGTALGTDDSQVLSGTQDWTQLGLQFTAPPGATSVRVEFRLRGAGTLWADDVVVTDGSPPPPPPTTTATTTTTTATTTTTPPPVGGNLAPDPDFEWDPNASYYVNGNGTFSWASDQARSGSRSLKIVSSDSSSMSRWMSLTSLIPVTPGRAYTASVWLKTAGVSDAHLSSVLWSGGTALGTDDSQVLSGTQDWTQVSLQVNAPPGATSVRVEFRLRGAGTLWADDVSVQQQ